MKDLSTQPILVTGSHRSGSTWVGQTLAMAPGTTYYNEPFNVEPSTYALDGLARQHFTYAEDLDQNRAKAAFQKLLDRRTGKPYPRRTPQRYLPWTRGGRQIIKDPIACLSSDWIARNFDVAVLVIIRHPGAFTDSLRRMGWEPDLAMFTSQPGLVRDHLQEIQPTLRAYDNDFITRAALSWKLIHTVLQTYIERHPEWIVRTHEQISLNPVDEFRELYRTFDLTWNATIATQIAEQTGEGNQPDANSTEQHVLKRDSRANITRWQERLNADEMEIIRRITYPEWTNYYQESDWKRTPAKVSA
ncbi:MAG: sulfotransferase [Opitutales bacterium]